VPAFVQRVGTFNTATGGKTAAITPAVGGLLVVIEGYSGGTRASSTDVTDDQGGTYTKLAQAEQASGARSSSIWVRDTLVSSAVSHTVSQGAPPGTETGGGIQVMEFSGFTVGGSGVLVQSAQQDSQAASTTPAPTFPQSAATGNLTIGQVLNASTTANLTEPSGWAERNDSGYNTPATGLEYVTRDSGFTGTTITWGSTSPTAFCDIIVELANNAASDITAPTDIGKNTPSAGSTSSTVTFTTTATVPSGGKILLAVGWFSAGATLSSVSATGCTGNVMGQQANGSDRFALAYLDAPSGLASGSTVTATFSASTADSRYICGSYIEGAATGDGYGFGGANSSTVFWDTPDVSTLPAVGDLVHGGSYNATGSTVTSEPSIGKEIHDFNVASDSAMTDTWSWAGGGPRDARGVWSASGTIAAAVVAYAPASGPTTQFGVSATALTMSFTTVGKRTRLGASTFPLTMSFTTSGKRAPRGISTFPLSLSFTTVGHRLLKSSSTFPLTISYATSGRRAPRGVSTFPLSITFTTFIPGTKTEFGASTFPLTVSYTSQGQKNARGASTFPLTISYTTQGKRTARSSSTFPLTISYASQAKKTAFGTSAYPLVISYSSRPASPTGTSTFPLTIGFATSGKVTRHGQSLFPLSLGLTSRARADHFAASVFPLSISYTASGTKTGLGASTLPLVFLISSSWRPATIPGDISLGDVSESSVSTSDLGLDGLAVIDSRIDAELIASNEVAQVRVIDT